MPQRQIVHEGKSKILFRGPEPGTLIQHFKDDVTAGDGQKHAIITGKGALNNLISEHLFKRLGEIGIPNHFLQRLNMLEQLVREVEVIPIEVVVRNVAAGSLVERFRLKEGAALPRPLVELYHKSDSLRDPMVSREHVEVFGWAEEDDLSEMTDLSLRVNDYLRGLLWGVGLQLVDFKLEFGQLWDQDDNPSVVLADEISPDSCRLWDRDTGERLDKDRFRQGLGGVVQAYQEVARRFGLIPSGEIAPADQPADSRSADCELKNSVILPLSSDRLGRI